MDMLDDILKHLVKETQPNVMHPHNRQMEEDTWMSITSDTQQRDINTNRIAVDNEQNKDPNYTAVKSNND